MKKSNFYLLYSGDKSLLSNEVNKLKKNLNITSDSIYYDIENVSDIIVEASTIGMFDPYKFIVIDSGSYFLQKSEFDICIQWSKKQLNLEDATIKQERKDQRIEEYK